MSRAYATPLELELSVSKLQHALLIMILLIAVISILCLSWSLVSRLLCVMVILAMHSYLIQGLRSCHHLVWQSGNNWKLTINNKTTSAMLLQESFVTSWLVILLFRNESGRRQSVLIWSDSVQLDVFRQLRVRLKLEGEKLVANIR